MIFTNQPNPSKERREQERKWANQSLKDTKTAVQAHREKIAKIHAEGREVDRTCYLRKVGRAQEILGRPGVELTYKSDLDSVVELKQFTTLSEARSFAGRMKDYIGQEMADVRRAA